MFKGSLRLCTFLVLSYLALASSAGADTLTYRGGKVKWEGRIEGMWWGGNTQDIERTATRLGNGPRSQSGETLRTILLRMLPLAKDKDLYITSPDVTATTTEVLTTIEANVLHGDLDLANEATRAIVWAEYIKLLTNEAPSGERHVFALQTQETSFVGGRAAYSATFIGRPSTGGTYYVVVHFVDLSKDRWHIFKMKADSAKFSARRSEYLGLLRSIRYSE
jgi:hypothetical protein